MTPQRIVRSYLIIAGLYNLSASLIWGVNTLFLLDAGLNIAEVFIANAAFTVGMVLFEIPTGVVADTQGRRTSFLLSVVVVLIATLGYVAMSFMGGTLLLFSLFSVILGLGFTFYSGAVEAWLVDALTATGYDGDLDRVFARGSMVTGAAMLLGSVGGGVIGTFELALPYVARSALLVMVFVVAFFTMRDIGYEPKPVKLRAIPREMRKLASASIRYGWEERQVRLLMLASFIQFGFMAWAFYAWQPYFLELYGNPDAIWVAGIITALLSLSTIVGNTIVEWATRFCGKRTTLMLISMALFTVAMVGVGLTDSFWVAVSLFLFGMGTMGVAGPVRQSFIHNLIPSAQRATVLSVDSMFSSAGGIVSQTSLGQLSLRAGIGTGYIVGGAVTILCLPIIYALRRMDDKADIIVGVPKEPSAQAGQGLPSVCQVETRATQETPAVGD